MKKPKVTRYFVTSAQPGAPVHKGFFKNLELACAHRGAKILVIPLKGFDSEDLLSPRITSSPYVEIVSGERDLSAKLAILQLYVPVTSRFPLSGLKSIIEVNRSAIIGSPKQHLQTYPNSNIKLPKIAMSTGAVTEAYYPHESKPHQVAASEHVLGAIYLEIGDMFHHRGIQALEKDGSFIDLCEKWSGKKKPSFVSPAAMVMGDIHTGDHDPETIRISKEMIKLFGPKRLILHDLFDGCSVNHHEANNITLKARRFARGDLRAEFQACVDMLKDLQSAGKSSMEIKVVKSNHDEFLNRYLSEGQFAKDPRNLHIAAYCTYHYTNSSITKDPLKLGLELINGGAFHNIEFLRRQQDLFCYGWQLANHGDKGVRGRKNITIQEIAQVVGKAIVGHTHTPGIFKNAVIVGTSSILDPEYKQGTGNDWMHTHALLYPNGKAQLINIIDGKYEF